MISLHCLLTATLTMHGGNVFRIRHQGIIVNVIHNIFTVEQLFAVLSSGQSRRSDWRPSRLLSAGALKLIITLYSLRTNNSRAHRAFWAPHLIMAVIICRNGGHIFGARPHTESGRAGEVTTSLSWNPRLKWAAPLSPLAHITVCSFLSCVFLKAVVQSRQSTL